MSNIIKSGGNGLTRKGGLKSLLKGVKSVKGAGDAASALTRPSTPKVRSAGEPEFMVLVLDTSHSMTANDDHSGVKRIDALKTAAKGLILRSNARFSVISYSEHYDVVGSSMDRQAALRAIDSLATHTTTNIAEPFDHAVRIAAAARGFRVRRVIVMTDGMFTDVVMEENGQLESLLYDDNESAAPHKILAAAKEKAKSQNIVVDAVMFELEQSPVLEWLVDGLGVIKKAMSANELVKEFKMLEAKVRGLLTS